MVKPIEFDDVFGYDDHGRACAVQLHGNVYAFGYAFCGHLKPLLDAGQPVANRLFEAGIAFIFVFDPSSKAVDLWDGRWAEDDQGVYSIVDPARKGFMERTFDDFAAVLAFAKSEMGPIALRPDTDSPSDIPPASAYIDHPDHCLHLWRSINEWQPRPPTRLVFLGGAWDTLTVQET